MRNEPTDRRAPGDYITDLASTFTRLQADYTRLAKEHTTIHGKTNAARVSADMLAHVARIRETTLAAITSATGMTQADAEDLIKEAGAAQATFDRRKFPPVQ